jgi:transcriptional regulator with XRE-family HTH domain
MAKGQSKRSVIFLSFGRRLRKLRLAKGLTPFQFSRATGIDADTLREYEEGKLEPKLEVIVVMAGALGVGGQDLIDIEIDDRDLR